LTYFSTLLLLRLSEQDRAMLSAVLRRGSTGGQPGGSRATVRPDDETR
jgi:hypothetical protein